MSRTTATWSPEFKRIVEWLTTANALVRAEGYDVLREETEGAARDLAQRVRRKTGRLARSIRTEYPSSTVLLAKVRMAAPHAHLQFGTKERFTRAGWRRGAMPDVDVLVGIARARRSQFASRLRSVAERNGFTVKG